ncbi:MAG: aminoglycoside phosphotransferase family protein [Chloroflexi bacterium]|nr:aminoglycoside phosphotransferase family protein [Chloroflexota bacterium]
MSRHVISPSVESAVVQATHRSLSDLRLSLRPPLDFQSNRLYDLWVDNRHWIVKEFLREAEWQDAPRREFRALELFAPLDIAPRPIFYDPALGPVVIYEYLDGVMWDRRKPSAAELNQLAEVWLKLSEIPTDGLWHSRGFERTLAEIETMFRTNFQIYADWASVEFGSGKCVGDWLLKVLDRRHAVMADIARRIPRLCFCRADPRFANVIARPNGRLGMVDWEDSGLRDPARDLADFITHPNQEDLLSFDEWQAFLKPYLDARKRFDADIEERMHLYLGIFPLFWLSVLVRWGVQKAKAGQLAGWTINELPANLRLQRYLNRLLAWDGSDKEDAMRVEFFPT